jgi:spoIIIJ-associated protein
MKEQENSLEEIIRETTAELLTKMGFKVEIDIEKNVTESNPEIINCNIRTNESNFLIGQYGVNLYSLQHIIRLLVRRKTDELVNFTVDVNSYRQEKNNSIEKMTRDIAEEVIRERKAIVMRPMSAYERRIVHMELSKNTRVKTESIGEGDERKVVVKPISEV